MERKDDDERSKKQRKENDDSAVQSNTISDIRNSDFAATLRLPVQTDQSSFDDTSDDHGKNLSTNVERKRVREQKRRSDITNAIDLLVQALIQIDMPIASSTSFNENQNVHSDLSLSQASIIAHASGSVHSSTRTNTNRLAAHQLPYNRSEIISYAKQVLERIHHENIALKHEVECLKNILSSQQTSQQVCQSYYDHEMKL